MDETSPQATKKCPFCGQEIHVDAAKCRFCGEWLTKQPAQQAVSSPAMPPAVTPASPVPGMDAYQLLTVYDPWFDLNGIPTGQREEFKKHTMFETFSVGGAIALHYVTFGIFTIIFMGLKHSRLPPIRPDDFRAGRAIGFLFIPFFNIYWIFVFWLRLADRINFQFRLRGLPAPVTRGLVLTTVIIGIIPYVGIISWLVLYPIVISEVQGACNRLATGAR
jgi:hypothetical protein